ncbi:MAG TPA: hypothetical protein VL992_18935 [Tepidisphaeraceae bacterium]|nr:hypothetical protein [Tepidisphaeraceae bacterium]
MPSVAIGMPLALDVNWPADPAPALARVLDKHRFVLFGLLAAFYLAGFNGQWQLEPDSALYLTLGRNIALGRGYTYHGLPHDLAYPGLPYALSVVFRVFGSHAIAAADLLMILFGWAMIACTYRLIDLAYDRPTAVVVALGVGISHELFRYCDEIMTDVPFAAGVAAFLAGYQGLFGSQAQRRGRHWWDAALLVIGLVIVLFTRPTMIGLLAAWAGAVVWAAIRRRGFNRWRLAATAIGIGALAAILMLDPRRGAHHWGGGDYETYAFSAITANLRQRLTTDVPANLADLLFGGTAARAFFGLPLGVWWLNAFFGSIPLIAAIALIRANALWGLWVLMTLGMMALLVSHDRYLLQIMPLMVLGWWQFISAVGRRSWRGFQGAIFALLLALGTLPNLCACGIVVVHQHMAPFLAGYKNGHMIAYVQAAQCVSAHTAPGDIIVVPEKMSRIVTFLSDRIVEEETEFHGGPAGANWFVLLDRDDAQYVRWLASQHIVAVGPPLEKISRPGQSPLKFSRATKD